MTFARDDDWGDYEYERRRDLRLDEAPPTQLSQFNASAVRIAQSADTLRDLADRISRETDMTTVAELMSDATSELSTIHRHCERGLRLATDMHSAIRASDVTVCHQRPAIRQPNCATGPSSLDR
jgi:hypothetical protein